MLCRKCFPSINAPYWSSDFKDCLFIRKGGKLGYEKTVSCLCSFIFCRHFQKIVDFTHATRYHNEVNTEDFNEGERAMTILVKDDNGNVVLEREIKKEEVLLKVCVRDDNRMSGTGEYSLEQVCGAYH